MSHPITILIAAPQALSRKGLEALLHRADNTMRVVGSHRTLEALQTDLKKAFVHVILLDDEIAAHDDVFGMVADLHAAAPQTAIVVISGNKFPGYIQMIFDAGASGFICRDEELDESLPIGIQTVLRGILYASPQASGLLLQRRHRDELSALTEKELNILRLIDEGLSLKTIAARLGLSLRTVYRTRTQLCELLNAPTHEHLVAAARGRGLISDKGRGSA